MHPLARFTGCAPLAVRRAILMLALGCAVLLGFAYGRSYKHAAQGQILGVPGLQDYQALTTYNHYSIVRANGPSMEPTMAEYNYLLVRDTKEIHRGDIIISGHHGMHRVVGLHGDTVWLRAGKVRVCTPRPGAAPYCRVLVEPWVRFSSTNCPAWGPLVADHGYVTVPDNRYCPQFMVFVPDADVVGVYAGSLLSYGPVHGVKRPLGPTLVYEPPAPSRTSSR
jgi:signal peptidase I